MQVAVLTSVCSLVIQAIFRSRKFIYLNVLCGDDTFGSLVLVTRTIEYRLSLKALVWTTSAVTFYQPIFCKLSQWTVLNLLHQQLARIAKNSCLCTMEENSALLLTSTFLPRDLLLTCSIHGTTISVGDGGRSSSPHNCFVCCQNIISNMKEFFLYRSTIFETVFVNLTPFCC